MRAKIRIAAGICGIIIGILLLIAVNWEFLKQNADFFLNITAVAGIFWGLFLVVDTPDDDDM